MERYRVDRVIGEGSFGKAILCARIADGKACVVKQVDTSKFSPKGRLVAGREATVLAKLSHPNIVGFWESFFHGPSNDVLCIVMDYADGGDLSSCLKRRKGRLVEEDVVLDWFVQTTLALKHIHDRKILHRDLKTQNIFLTSSRKVKLGDFGIAKVLENTLDLTRTAVGTPYYMSPEICQEKRYNHKSDIWSLGCVLYEMISLRHAFEGRDMRTLMMKICAYEPKPISSRYGAGTRALLAHLLKKEARARPSTDVILRRPLLKDRIRRFLSDEQIREEFGERTSPSAPGLPRTPSARDPTSRKSSKANVLGREHSDAANAASGKQNLGSGIVGSAVGAGARAGARAGAAAARAGARAGAAAARAGAGAARDSNKSIAEVDAINRARWKERGQGAGNASRNAKALHRNNGGGGGDVGDGGRRGKQSGVTTKVTTKASAHRASDARRGQALSNVTRAAPGIRVNSPRNSPSPRGERDAARGKGAPSGWKLSRAKPIASPRSGNIRPVASPWASSRSPVIAAEEAVPGAAAAGDAGRNGVGRSAAQRGRPKEPPQSSGRERPPGGEGAGSGQKERELDRAKREREALAVFGWATREEEKEGGGGVRTERKVDDAPKPNDRTTKESRNRQGDKSSPTEVKSLQSPSNAPLPSSVPRGTPRPSPKLLEAVAAIETAAAAVLALPSQTVEKPASAVGRDRRGDDGAGVGGVRGGKAGAAMADGRAFSPPLVSAEVKVVLTPVQPRGRGRGARRAFGISKSDSKPPSKRAGAGAEPLVAESERHSADPVPRNSWMEKQIPSFEDKDDNIRNLSPKERANAVRVIRDRDRAKLRAMIAQRRKAADEGEDEIAQERTSRGSDRPTELKTPRGRVAGHSDAREAMSEPPPRRILRSPIGGGRGNGKGVLNGGREKPGKFSEGASVNASRQQRRTPSRSKLEKLNAEGGKEGKEVPSVEAVKDPAKRRYNLRTFIAKGRQEQRRAKQSDPVDSEDDDISVWISPPAANRYRDASGADAHADDSRRAVGSACSQPEAKEACSVVARTGEELSREALVEGRQLQSELGNVNETPSHSAFSKPTMMEKASSSSPRGADTINNLGHPYEDSLENRSGMVGDSFDGIHVVNEAGSLNGLDTYNCQRMATAKALTVAEGSKVGVCSWEQEYAQMLQRMDAKEVMELGGGGGGGMDSSWGSSSAEADESRGVEAREKRNEESDYFGVEETKGVGWGEDIAVASDVSSSVNGVRKDEGEGKYIGYRECGTRVSQEASSLHQELAISQTTTANNGTAVGGIGYLGGRGKWEPVETEFGESLAGEGIDIAYEEKAVDGSQETFRQRGFRSSELEYSGSRLSGSASENCEADEILRAADVSDDASSWYHARRTDGSELRGIELLRSRPGVGDVSRSPDKIGRGVSEPQCDLAARDDGAMEEAGGDRGDARGAGQTELTASHTSGFPLNLRSEYSCAVRPSLRTPETGRERLSRFGQVNVEGTNRETRRGLREILRGEELGN